MFVYADLAIAVVLFICYLADYACCFGLLFKDKQISRRGKIRKEREKGRIVKEVMMMLVMVVMMGF
ncbi:hypothetical protein BDCR2A_01714 [Borrelia duttonii CR2A]|uniref:Uncharacterized protein n=1 Tax=Borrelia duttonii CR2A TaxID=1432657 RepID=W6TG99_9SPIR|nr:hypothetical protein [Borrelia duttonii]ETZ17368.1 hypothetical protein BDCR2A_01714 [Borrelia duttonii CR2A]